MEDEKLSSISSVNELPDNQANIVLYKPKKKPEEQVETLIVVPPDGGWGWMVVVGAFFSFLIADGVIYAFGIFLKDMSITFNCSKSQIAFAGAIMTGCFCLAGPFIAALVNRFGYRIVAIIGSVLATISCILTSYCPTLLLVYLCHGVIGGIGFGMIYVPAVIVVGFYFERWRALATGIAVCGAGIGGIALPPVFTILLNDYGWRQTYRMTAAMSIFCAFCALLFRPLKPIRVKSAVEKKQSAWSDTESAITTASTEEERKNFFSRYHNAAYPTTAEIVQAKSTVTIMHPRKLPRNVSSEFLMSASPKGSFKSVRTFVPEYADSRLSTVYEEKKTKCGNCCIQCCKSDSEVSQSLAEKRRCCGWEKNTSKVSFQKIGWCERIHEKYFRRKRDEITAVRPLYRDDIFYSGSLILLPEYKKSAQTSHPRMGTSRSTKSRSVLEYHMSVSRIGTQKDFEEQEKCAICSEAVKRTIATMLDFSLLKSPSFLLLAFNAVFISMGWYTPYMFIKDRAIQNGIPEETAFWLISAIGVMNTIGRITSGILTSCPRMKAIVISYVSLFVGGVATALSGLSYTVWAQFTYAGIYGFCVACMSTLRTIIIVEMLGLDKLTNAMGIILMFQGMASLVGTTLSGILRDLTGAYNWSFYFSGGCICFGSVLLVPIKSVSNKEKARKAQESVIEITSTTDV